MRFNILIPVVLMALLLIGISNAQPTNIINVYPVYLNNTQTIAAASPYYAFTAMIVANLSTMSNITYNGSFSNMEFYYPSNDTIIPSWIESNSSGNLTIWLAISAGIPASTNETVYMGLSNNTTNMLNNSINGEAPQLSPTYAEYDDGAEVFPLGYLNFARTNLGTLTPANFCGGNVTGTASVNNTLNFTAGSDNCQVLYFNATGSLIPYLSEQYTESIVGSNTTGGWDAGIGVSSAENYNSGTDFWLNGMVTGTSGTTWEYSISGTNTTTTDAMSLGTPYIFGMLTNGTNNTMFVDSSGNTPLYSVNSTVSFPYSNYSIVSNLDSNATQLTKWIFYDIYPPNGVMPTYAFGAVKPAYTPLSAVVSPLNTTLDSGQSITLTATAVGGTSPYTYQWYNATGTPSAISGANTSSIDISGVSTGTFEYFVSINDSNSTANSTNATIIVNPALLVNPITPTSPAIDNGQSITLTANVSGGTPPYTYQWAYGSSSSSCDNDISGATSRTYTASPTSNIYYCYITSDSATISDLHTSASNLITVNSALTASISTSTPTVSSGQNFTLTASPSGGTSPYSYQWYNTTSGSAVAISGATGSSLTLTTTTAGLYSYYATVTDSAYSPETVTTATETITVNPTVSISPLNTTLDAGQSVTLTSSSNGATSYQWYNDTSGTPSAISGATSSTLTIQAITTGTFEYYLTAYGNNSTSANSATATIIANPTLFVNSITPSNPSIDSGQSITLTASGIGGTTPYTYEWFSGSSSSSCNTAISNSNVTTLSVSPSSTTYYCYQLTDSATTPESILSPVNSVTVNPTLTATLSPVNTTLDAGQSITLTVTALNGTTPYSYIWYNDSSGTPAVISNATSSTLTLTGTQGTFVYYAVVNDSSATPETVTTNNATLNVNPALQANPISPSSPIIDNGQSITLIANVSGGTLPYSYQWYSGASSTSCTNIISNATSSNYTASPSASTYYCYSVTDSATPSETNTSASNLITVNPSLTATISPTTLKLNPEQNFTLTITALNGTAPYSYQWYNDTNGTAVAISGANASTYTSSLSAYGTYVYYAVVTDSAYSPETVTTNNSTIIGLEYVLNITAIPNSVKYPNSPYLSVYAVDTNITTFTINISIGSSLFVSNTSYVSGTVWNITLPSYDIGTYNVTANATDSYVSWSNSTTFTIANPITLTLPPYNQTLFGASDILTATAPNTTMNIYINGTTTVSFSSNSTITYDLANLQVGNYTITLNIPSANYTSIVDNVTVYPPYIYMAGSTIPSAYQDILNSGEANSSFTAVQITIVNPLTGATVTNLNSSNGYLTISTNNPAGLFSTPELVNSTTLGFNNASNQANGIYILDAITSNDSTLYLNGSISYTPSNLATFNYLFTNTKVIAPNTLNLNLYALTGTSIGSFYVTVTSGVTQIPSNVQLYYLDSNTNTYPLLSYFSTPSTLGTIIQVQNNATYSFNIYNPSTNQLIGVISNVQLYCPAGSVCDLNLPASIPTSVIFNQYGSITYSCTNSTTELTCSGSDPTTNTASYKLLVQQIGIAGTSTVCDTAVSASNAQIVCSLPSNSTDYQYSFYATSTDGTVTLLETNYVSLASAVSQYGTTGLIAVAIILIILSMLAISSPVLVIVMDVFAIALSGILGFFVLTITAFVQLLVILVIYVYKLRH